MGFSQALSGLNASATNLDVIGNNIANSQTVGFKGASALFADVFAGAKTGLGVQVADVLQDFSTGTLENTGRTLDLAIDGDGFFRMSQGGQVMYSRNGQFSMDEDGYIVNAQGARLTGYPAGVQAGGNPVDLQVPSAALPAQASTAIEGTLNLDRDEPALAAAFDETDASTYSYANNVTLFDSQGSARNTTMFFTKTGANTWEVRLMQDGVLADDGGGTPVVGNLVFDVNGVIDEALTDLDTLAYNFAPGGGVADLAVSLDLTGTTQFAGDFELKSVDQDGIASGALVGITIEKSGDVVGNYSNEESRSLGVISLVNFSNPEGLVPQGDNAWVESATSGAPLLGMAGTGKFGAIESGVVETSNVDLTKSLVDLIIAQRNYQANSQTIKVQDEVLQNAVNLR